MQETNFWQTGRLYIQNAWAYHGLACLYLKSDPEKAKQFIMEGMALQREETILSEGRV